MNLRQLRYLCEIADQDLNLSKAAKALHTSQPGISKQIRMLEEELEVDVLVRRRNRIVALTAQGHSVLEIARRMLREAENLRRVGADLAREDRGSLVVATTHVHARYILLPVVKHLRERFPKVSLRIVHGNPDQIAQLVAAGDADLGISAAPIMRKAELAMLPLYRIHRCVLVPRRHALLKKKRVSLQDLARYPLINIDSSFAGGASVMSAFHAKQIEPDVVLSATDTDVIKAYVEAGLGVATLPTIAFDARRDRTLQAIDADHLFEPSLSYVWLHRHYYMRSYVSAFINMLSPAWTREAIDGALRMGEPVSDAMAIDPR